MESLPSRERGLKFAEAMQDGLVSGVAPLAGAWIEMGEVEKNRRVVSVAPLAGAWIELCGLLRLLNIRYSLPSRERGLILIFFFRLPQSFLVAPLAGAWIEIQEDIKTHHLCRVAPLAGAWIEILLFRLISV